MTIEFVRMCVGALAQVERGVVVRFVSMIGAEIWDLTDDLGGSGGAPLPRA